MHEQCQIAACWHPRQERFVKDEAVEHGVFTGDGRLLGAIELKDIVKDGIHASVRGAAPDGHPQADTLSARGLLRGPSEAAVVAAVHVAAAFGLFVAEPGGDSVGGAVPEVAAAAAAKVVVVAIPA